VIGDAEMARRVRTGKDMLADASFNVESWCADCVRSSGGLLPPSPPAEKATAQPIPRGLGHEQMRQRRRGVDVVHRLAGGCGFDCDCSTSSGSSSATVRASSARSRQCFGSLMGIFAMAAHHGGALSSGHHFTFHRIAKSRSHDGRGA